jgi:hypothetical protein
MKIYVERFEKPFNYMTYDQEEEVVHVDGEKKVRDQRLLKEKLVVDREEIVEKEVRRQKEQYTK